MYKAFIDDERYPVDYESTVIVRNMSQFVDMCEQMGCPTFISFDHDLGESEATGYDIAKWMIEKDLDMDMRFIPEDFSYYVHSQNPVGAANIENLLDNYLGQRFSTY